MQDEKGRTLKWGDEVEYLIVKLDHKVHLFCMLVMKMMTARMQAKAARVSLRADELLKQLVQPEERMKEEVGNDDHDHDVEKSEPGEAERR